MNKKLKIMFLDDDRDMRFYVQSTLSSIADVTGVGSIQEGLNLLKNDFYPIILVDILSLGRNVDWNFSIY